MAKEYYLYKDFIKPAWSYLNKSGKEKVAKLKEEAKTSYAKAWEDYRKASASADFSIALRTPDSKEFYSTLNFFIGYKKALMKTLLNLKLRGYKAEWQVGFAIESAVKFLDEYSASTLTPTRFFSLSKYIYERDTLGKTTFYHDHHRTYNITIADDDFLVYTDLVPVL